MAKFKEKLFIVPLVIAGIGTAASIGFGANEAVKSKKAYKKQQEDNAKMTEAINNLAKSNPEKAKQVSAIMETREEEKPGTTQTTSAPSQSAYSIVGGAKAAGKVVWELAKGHKKKAISGIVTGSALAGGGIVADKVIRSDMKRSGLAVPTNTPMAEQKVYSRYRKAIKLVKSTGRKVATGAKEYAPEIALTGGLTSAPVLMGYYGGEKAQLIDQQRATKPQTARQATYSVAAVLTAAKPLITKAGVAAARSMKGMKLKAVRNLRHIKADPVGSTLSGMSKLAGGGGRSGVKKMGTKLTELGAKHSSGAATKAGEFILKNPKTAMAASVPVGLGVMEATWGAGEAAVNKVAKTLDKDTLAYQNSKNQVIQ